jgi:HK97 family phage major capsid protein
MNVQELKDKRGHAFKAADAILSSVERQKRPMTAHETQTFDARMREVRELDSQIAAQPTASTSTYRETLNQIPQSHRIAPSGWAGGPSEKYGKTQVISKRLSPEYESTWLAWVSGKGPLSASLEEGVGSAGGFAVPFRVDQKIVPLAPQDSAVRSLALVVETESDIRIPGILTRGTGAIKTEGSAFSQGQPSLSGFTLSAFMIGNKIPASIDLLQDTPWAVEEMLIPDAESDQLELEESFYVNGTGSGQAQGLIGNVGVGVTCEPDSAGNVVSVDAVWQVVASLKDRYASNASFLLSRTTALGIRRAQVQTGSYEMIFRRENGIDLLAGFPCAYSTAMPAAQRGNTPVLFGDFKRGYIIGDRGGSALFVKRLDQTPLMVSNGEIELYFYRRSDGRVRIAEAIQSLTIAAS